MISKIKSALSGLFPLIAIFFIVSNFVLSCRAYKMASPVEYHHYHEITNNVVSSSSFVVSNQTLSVRSVTSSGSSVPSVPREYTIPYQFIISGGAPCIRYYGRYYYEGDQLSLGRIYRIFPDRVFLQNGDVLINSASPSSFSPPPTVSPSPSRKPLKGLFKDDR